jgi:Ca2+-binding EF-hand superfamily protein
LRYNKAKEYADLRALCRDGQINHGNQGKSSSWLLTQKAITERLGDIQGASEELLQEKIKELYNEMRGEEDTEGIRAVQLEKAMCALGLDVEEDMLTKMMDHADENHDGVIEWHEFLPLVRTIIHK